MNTQQLLRLLFSFVFFAATMGLAQNPILTPDKAYGKLFVDVQMQRIFKDGKTFVDAVPKRSIANIVADYEAATKNPAIKFSLQKFVEENFTIPANALAENNTVVQPIDKHIQQLWKQLQRKADNAVVGSSLLQLPYPYIVPGGRFREVYYWDSYFTMLGLHVHKEYATIENMVNNFAYLISTYGHIPNGNRSYYLSRSQPPFFSHMLDLLAEHKGNRVYATFLKVLQQEYDYWMDKTAATKHVVTMPNGSILNRYYDADAIPRQESYKEDVELATAESKKLLGAAQAKRFANICKELRTGAESGWDFSTRWFADGKNINTIITTQIVPVDLNGLLYHMELTLAKSYKEIGNLLKEKYFTNLAAKRKAAINKYCYNAADGWYYDFNLTTKQQSKQKTLAGITPLFFNIAPAVVAKNIAATTEKYFLKQGGLLTTLENSGQQWDSPNGWAPLQWMAVQGLLQYNQKALALNIAKRWTSLNERVYNNTGKLMEKYNVVDVDLPAGGGEYDGQDGFGWTNGVYIKMKTILQQQQ
jgi:alpha,alpha-trehalase